MSRYLVVGGAGFIGSYVVDHLLTSRRAEAVLVYDNFSAGRHWHLQAWAEDPRLRIISADIYDPILFSVACDVDVTFHLAANPDIAKAITEPDIDFRQGTALTQIVIEALRKGSCRKLIYASGSGVYGDTGTKWIREDHAPMEPISTYGASKLACEALIASYCHMFDFVASVFRFGNVVGGRQTHGVAYDFIRKLKADCSRLEIMGDGDQSKPYVDVDDVVCAMMIAVDRQTKRFDVYNVAPHDFVTVREIADIVLAELGVPKEQCELRFGTSNRGWKGDVPVVRLVCDKIRALGWTSRFSSTEAVRRSVRGMLANIENLYTNA
jgi:UDP-glucose 4-epimerase